MENKIQNIKNIVSKIENKDFQIYFFTLDTKGNPTAGVSNIYEQVKELNKLGYNAHILHEKKDYKIYGDENGAGISDWLGNEYGELSHVSIEGTELNIGPQDFLIIPEIFSNVMEQTKNFPCKKIVLGQSYAYALELLPIGKSWLDYGFNDVITTSEKQSIFYQELFPSIKTKVIPVSISDMFKAPKQPKLPIVTLHTRNSSDSAKIIKMFYLKNPSLRWISFKELKGLKKEVFAKELRESCLSVWIDDVSGFGTFPLESIKSQTPVIGKIPDMVPEWMEIEKDGDTFINNNGMWVNNINEIPDLIKTYLQLWLEDSIPNEMDKAMEETSKLYTTDEQISKIDSVFSELVNERILELNNMVERLKDTKINA